AGGVSAGLGGVPAPVGGTPRAAAPPPAVRVADLRACYLPDPGARTAAEYLAGLPGTTPAR
ncbi:hypothetical protein, partial [Nocardia farcinica]|uniref:hypothetical protein n=1 Tax=Nocardia farcinica TaxID=37329 RepID=UPI002457A6BB